MLELNFNGSNSNKYKIKAIENRAVYTNKIKNNLLSLYYLVA